MAEEHQLLKHCLVCLFRIVHTIRRWQSLYKLHLLLNIEHFLDIDMLLDMTIDLPCQLIVDVMLIGQLFKDLQVLAALDIL